MATVKVVKGLCIAAALGVLVGCASGANRDPRDPWEGFNRTMYGFNKGLDNALVKPLAQGYQAITPEPVDRGVTNFFSNVGDVGSAVNNALQFKLARASSDVWRVLINSTIGVFGLIDVASHLHLDKYGEDFGQTLGYWGMGTGPYLVLPFFGPRNVRDAFGLVVDWHLDPVNYVNPDEWRYGLHVLRVIDKRADLLGAGNVLDEAALDEYTFVRDAYLQKRDNDVRDGASTVSAEGGEEVPGNW